MHTIIDLTINTLRVIKRVRLRKQEKQYVKRKNENRYTIIVRKRKGERQRERNLQYNQKM